MTPMGWMRYLVGFCLLAAPCLAQTATLRGQVTDESGAVVPGAQVTVNGPGGLSKTTVTSNDGSYVFADLAIGNYVAQASAPALKLRQPLRSQRLAEFAEAE